MTLFSHIYVLSNEIELLLLLLGKCGCGLIELEIKFLGALGQHMHVELLFSANELDLSMQKRKGKGKGKKTACLPACLPTRAPQPPKLGRKEEGTSERICYTAQGPLKNDAVG